MCAGCVAGVVAFAANVRADSFFYKFSVVGTTDRQRFELQASSDNHSAVLQAFFSMELLCIIFARNMLLRRVSDHASHSYYNDARDHDDDGNRRFDWRDCVGQYKMYYLVRALHVVTMALCVLHVVARFVNVAHFAESARLQAEAAAACDAEGRDTRSLSDKQEWSERVLASQKNTAIAHAPAAVLEGAVLTVTAGGFLLFSPACIVMFRRLERKLHAIVQEMSLRSEVGTVFLPFEFSPEASDGARTQLEMTVVEARAFLGRMKSAAASQCRRFLLCLVLVLAALVIQALDALFTAFVHIHPFFAKPNPSCDYCGSCQSIEHLMSAWYTGTPELFPLIISTCSTLPLLFSLWLMLTKEDRELLLHPGRFRIDAIALQPASDELSARLKAERIRMGIELR
jgi:hypothetical protein